MAPVLEVKNLKKKFKDFSINNITQLSQDES